MKRIMFLYGLAMLAIGGVASATPIPVPIISVTAAGGTMILTSGTVNGTGCNGGYGCESSTATLNYPGANYVSASASGLTTGSDPANAVSEGFSNYYYEVLGPTGATALLMLTGNATTSTGGTDATGYDRIEWAGPTMYACSATGSYLATCLNGGSYMPTSFSDETETNAVTTNVLNAVLTVATGVSTLGTGSYSADVNDTLSFAPGNTCGSCELVFYSGTLTPAPISVPEPGTLALMGLGLLAVGLAIARRSRT